MNTIKFFVILLVVFLSPGIVLAAEYCNIGQDPLDPNRQKYMEPGESAIPLKEDALVLMRGKTRDYRCVLKTGEKIVFNENDPNALPWVYACGNTILEAPFLASVVEEQIAPDTDILLALANRPMGHVQIVDGSNAKARLTAEQFKFHFGASALWHLGLKGTKVFQSQSQTQKQVAEGGKGGGGGAGGDSSSTVTVIEKPVNGGGGGVDPNNPPTSGGGGTNPNNPGQGTGFNPNNP